MEQVIVPVLAEPLRTRAAAILRDAIVSGRLLPGTRLFEVQMAERFGVSRGTLRQALRELEHAGLVISVPYRGTYVAAQTPNSLRDAYSVRGLLEGFAATQIPASELPAMLATLRERVAEMRRAIDAGQLVEVAAIDISFHSSICAAAGNQRLTQLWEALSDPLQMRYANQIDVLYTPDEIIGRHEEFIALFDTGDSTRIEAGIRAHYMETALRMSAELEGVGRDTGGTP
jgi:DNA-binding GntR family transcriptional regulator